ncbi:hypothetical protein [Mucilaginibacter sp. L3T2-6]|uniref:hypothetical protein n=1 Tax=Mucilaginibacter sp. L3T2-6 TaxID=3062491 RepID=UPI00267531A9|nr:hypothetical protein [Mucilaginibacter sp. L3T2-6]MDO3644825.1 hypothetical protein [Mucilaginibacter sp. L3T2-6]MDV6217281.1 hypothetical protein [Mucilaginibacter sp. L3T2-6]
MNLQAEKLEVVRLILDTNDKTLLSAVKSLFKNEAVASKDSAHLEKFYDGFRDGIRDVKLSLEGQVELKNADTWLNEL